MSSPNWNPHGFAHDYTGNSRPYVRRTRRPPPTVEPDMGAVWASIHAHLEPQDSARMAWLAAHATTPDADEADAPPECEVCRSELLPLPVRHRNGSVHLRPPAPGQRVCHECSGSGWRSTPCVRCGGITHKRDRANKSTMPHLYGMCGACRATIRGTEAT